MESCVITDCHQENSGVLFMQFMNEKWFVLKTEIIRKHMCLLSLPNCVLMMDPS